MSEQMTDDRLRCKLYAEVFLSGFQMGYDMGLGRCWPAANCYAVFLWYYLRRSSNLLTYLLTYELNGLYGCG